MHTIVYLIRHGDVENPSGLHYGRFRDIGLSPKGFEQLEALGRIVEERGEKPLAIYVSPMRRAQESAQSFFADVPKVTLEDLNETDSKGFEGMPILEQRELVEKGFLTGKYWVEDKRHLAERMMHAFTKARNGHSGKVVAIISHGDPIAFLTYRLIHNKDSFPPYVEVEKDYFPEKGSGYRFVLDEKGAVVSYERVSSGVL